MSNWQRQHFIQCLNLKWLEVSCDDIFSIDNAVSMNEAF